MFEASIHGRFQPFHNGHLKYAQAALERSEFLYIGLTKVFPSLEPASTVSIHRDYAENNPFLYRERVDIIRSSLLSAGVDLSRFLIGPFPIEQPEKIREFVDPSGVCYTTVVDQWNIEKIGSLEKHGFRVEVLKDGAWVDEYIKSGTQIRALIRDGNSSWEDYVPAGAVCAIQDIIRTRSI